MNKAMRKFLDKHNKKFTKEIVNGLACEIMPGLMRYFDSILKSAVKTLPETIPFEYQGWELLTPKEDFYNTITSSQSKNNIDISRDYLYKVKFKFKYDKETIERVVALPFVDRGGVIILSDKPYAVVPVLSEYPISPAPGEVFIRLLRDKINIKRSTRYVIKNGEKIKIPYHYAFIYKLSRDKTKVNDKTPVAIFGFIKYGFYGFFEKFFNFKPKLLYGDYVDPKALGDDWVVYESTGVKPRILHMPAYKPHGLKIAVPKNKVSSFLEYIISGIMYIWDLSPTFSAQLIRVAGEKTEHIVKFSEAERLDRESKYWLTLLGKIIYKNKFSNDKLFEDMLEYTDLLSGYLDPIIKNLLRSINIDVEDFYDLIVWVIKHYDQLTSKYEDYSSKLENRYVDILYYILYETMSSINKAFLEFKRSAERKKLTVKEINRIFNKYMTTKKIFNLIKTSGQNLAIMFIDYSGDNYYFKITSILEDQSRGNGVVRNKDNVLPPNTRTLHAEDIAFGSMLYLIKSYPSPRFRFNPWIGFNKQTAKLTINEELRPIVNKLEEKLKRKATNTGNQELLDNEL